MNTHQDCPTSLPIRRNLTAFYALSLLVVILMALVSAAGILYRKIRGNRATRPAGRPG